MLKLPKKLKGDDSPEPNKTGDSLGVRTINTLALNLNLPPAQIKEYMAKRQQRVQDKLNKIAP
jgi:hypothetical protein